MTQAMHAPGNPRNKNRTCAYSASRARRIESGGEVVADDARAREHDVEMARRALDDVECGRRVGRQPAIEAGVYLMTDEVGTLDRRAHRRPDATASTGRRTTLSGGACGCAARRLADPLEKRISLLQLHDALDSDSHIVETGPHDAYGRSRRLRGGWPRSVGAAARLRSRRRSVGSSPGKYGRSQGQSDDDTGSGRLRRPVDGSTPSPVVVANSTLAALLTAAVCLT